jgi:hypothetical protein
MYEIFSFPSCFHCNIGFIFTAVWPKLGTELCYAGYLQRKMFLIFYAITQ